jgi:NifU-like protein involved in Fe-S cluster formation
MNVCNPNGNDNNWLYSNIVKDHFFNPRNFLVDEKEFEADGVGEVGSIACGDMMKVFIKVYTDEKGVERIKDCKWQTFGSASAIASTSIMSVMALEDKE